MIMLVRIMWCKEREENINKLIPQLWDNVEVIWDQKKDVVDTLCRTFDTDEPMIVLEDDVELCDNFLEKALANIEMHPDCFIMFYWANADDFITYPDEGYNGPRVWTQAYYIPWGRWIAKWMAEYVVKDEKYTPQGRYSNPMAHYLKDAWVKRHLVKPSLCQHLWFWGSLLPWHQHCNHSSRTYKKSEE